jgi:hypothetical protein
MVEENLVGYLLNALDAESQLEVEEYLATNREAKRQLELLRQALAPLEADREAVQPPPDLRVRTLARIAEHHCIAATRLPVAPAIHDAALRRSWFGRADVLIAASILILLLPFIPPVIHYTQQEYNKLACQNNLRIFHQALVGYSDQHNRLPEVQARPPRNFAGVFVPLLNDAGLLPSNLSVACPNNGRRPPKDITMKMLDAMEASNPEEYEATIRSLAGCYAYSLGYLDSNGHLQPIRPHEDNDCLPIMADRPPFEQKASVGPVTGNSQNHRISSRRGQNVLFLGGHVVFATTRNVGVDGDDIYLNRQNFPFAGTDRFDAVLGASDWRPMKPEE